MIKGGPKIINDGLVLCLDAHDAKSYAGEPVTNLYGDISTSTALRPNRTEYNTSGTWTTDMPMCPENVGRVYKHTSGALTSSWSGNSYGYMLKDIATTSGETYIVTCWVYVSSDCNISGCPVVIEQEASGESTVSGYDGGYDLNNKGTWQLLAKKCVADDQVRFIPLYPSRNGVTDGSFSGFFAWGGAQVVKASYVTPYVLSSRSATNGWVDRSGNSNSGTLTNMIGTGASHYRDGQVIMPVANSYLDFDGTNDELRLTSYNDLRFGDSGYSDNFSIEVWFKLDTLARSPLYDYYRYGLQAESNGTIGLWYNGNGGTWGGSGYGGSISTGVWYHGLGVHSEGNHDTVYLNGTAVSTDSTPVDIGSSTYGFLGPYVGHTDHVGGVFTNGQIAVVRVYNKALTAAEVLSNYNATKSRFT